MIRSKGLLLVYLLCGAAFFFPISVGFTVFRIEISVFQILMLAVFLVLFVFYNKFITVRPVLVPLFCVFFYFIANLFAGIEFESIRFLLSQLFFVIFSMILINVMRIRPDVEGKLIVSYIIGCSLSALIMILQKYEVFGFDVVGKSASGLMDNRNELAFFLLPASLLSCYYFLSGKRAVFMGLGTLFFMGSVFLSGSRSGFSVMIFFILLLFVFNKRNYFIKIISVYVGVAVFIVALLLFGDTLKRYDLVDELTGNTYDKSVSVRKELIVIAFDKFENSPFYGVGSGMFRKDSIVVKGVQVPPHNTYLGMLSEGGLIGFLAMLIYFFFPFYKKNKNYSIHNIKLKNYQLIFASSLCMAFFIDATGMVVIYMMWALIVGVKDQKKNTVLHNKNMRHSLDK